MKIPFDIKFRPQIESGEYKVETRDGRRVKIIYWDLNCTSPIVAVMDVHIDLPGEIVDTFSVSGIAFDDSESPSDLFIITPEPELSEFEKGYIRIVHKIKPEDFNDEGLKIAKEDAAELLELAKNEIYSHESLVEYAKMAREEGKTEARKDLPRWIDNNMPKGSGAIDISGLRGFDFIRRNEKLLRISDLEKLPGFND